MSDSQASLHRNLPLFFIHPTSCRFEYPNLYFFLKHLLICLAWRQWVNTLTECVNDSLMSCINCHDCENLDKQLIHLSVCLYFLSFSGCPIIFCICSVSARVMMLYKLNCLYFKNYLSPSLRNFALCSKVQAIISFPPNLITRIAAEEQFEDDDSIFSNNF
jgi:hypothetical protein